MTARSCTPRAYGLIMSALTLLFFLRVAGQALVAFFHISFLPAMQEWYSGLIPYPVLLPIQCAILTFMAKVSFDLVKGSGFFVTARLNLGRFLIAFSCVYFVGMVFRYGLTMMLHQERRWLGGAIPIFFHFVLAGYLFVWGRFNTMRGAS